MKRNIQSKRTTGVQHAGELPPVDIKGIGAAALALRDKFRSPFAFCRTGRTKKAI